MLGHGELLLSLVTKILIEPAFGRRLVLVGVEPPLYVDSGMCRGLGAMASCYVDSLCAQRYVS